MARRVTASDAKNHFGGLLDEVATHGRIEITKHGRVVAVLMAPRLLDQALTSGTAGIPGDRGETHMIPRDRARSARILRRPRGFDDG
jgi:prevent-host-death family protein